MKKNDKVKTSKPTKKPLLRITTSTSDKLVGINPKQIEELKKVALLSHEMVKLIEPSIAGMRKSVLLNLATNMPLINIAKQMEDAIYLKKGLDMIPAQLAKSILQRFEDMKSGLRLDLITMHQASIALKAEAFKNLEGIHINLPIGEIQKSLSEYSMLTVDIEEFKSFKPSRNEYLLRTTATETTDLGILKFKTVQQTQLQVQSLQGEVNEIKRFMLEDGKKKDEMLEELLDYFRNGGSSTVKIKKVKYNKKTAELIIDDKTISIKADTNQHYLCKILFASKKSIQKAWEIYDIVEAMGEDPSILDGRLKGIYSTVRHLNEKIQLQTGIDKFILYDNKTVIVNPKYLDLP